MRCGHWRRDDCGARRARHAPRRIRRARDRRRGPDRDAGRHRSARASQSHSKRDKPGQIARESLHFKCFVTIAVDTGRHGVTAILLPGCYFGAARACRARMGGRTERKGRAMAKPFMPRWLETVRPGAGQRFAREFPDPLLPRHYFVLQPSGAKSWAIRYRLGETTRKFTTGSYPLLGLGKARELAREALIAADRGQDPGEQRSAARRKASAAA